MRIGEPHPCACEPVDVRSWDFPPLRVVTLHIAVPQIVRQNDQHIRIGSHCARGTGDRSQAENDGETQMLHGSGPPRLPDAKHIRKLLQSVNYGIKRFAWVTPQSDFSPAWRWTTRSGTTAPATTCKLSVRFRRRS